MILHLILPFNCYQLSIFHWNVSVWLFSDMYSFRLLFFIPFNYLIRIFHLIITYIHSLHLNLPYNITFELSIWFFRVDNNSCLIIPFEYSICFIHCFFHIDIPYELSIWIIHMDYPLDNNFLLFSIQLFYWNFPFDYIIIIPFEFSI